MLKRTLMYSPAKLECLCGLVSILMLCFFNNTLGQPNATGIPLPRIRAVSDSSGAYFCYAYDTTRRFQPQGNNYVPLDSSGERHIAFGEGLYNGALVESNFSLMNNFGYNIVRVFINHDSAAAGQYGIEGPPRTNEATLYKPVFENLIDFIKRARKWNLYVILVPDGIPMNDYYWSKAFLHPPPHIKGENQLWLSGNYLKAKEEYLKNLATCVKNAESKGALLSSVFSWELENEGNLSDRCEPFNLKKDTVTTANGKTYSMADPVSLHG